MHFETHVRAAHGGGFNPAALKSTVYKDDEVSFLQVCKSLSASADAPEHTVAGHWARTIMSKPLRL